MSAPAEAAAVAPDVLAAVDLGSNSFHLIVARVDGGHLEVIDRLRETVRLAAGLAPDKSLSEEAMARALECLGRFGQRLRGMRSDAVRAVGTNTLRSARNAESFRREAQRVLGHPIQVIAGREEARLIYLGVAHSLAADKHRRLVIDIGGGSTEFIIGEGFEPVHRESLYMGCVSMSRAYFPDGRVDKASMRRAELAARVELEPIEARFRAASWQSVVGSSGTMRAVAAIAQAAGFCEYGISRAAVRKLRRALIEAGSVDRVQLKELRDDRRPVLAGGIAVLGATLDALDIDHLLVSRMALREGLLYDLLGRIRHEDVRDVTVRRLGERYAVDEEQAARVERTALDCLAQVAPAWGLAHEDQEAMLAWAAKLHELGVAVSHSQYHKHGAYLVANADLAGFSRQDQAMLAALVRGHRRKFPQSVFDALADGAGEQGRRLCVLLRLAVALHRSRSGFQVPCLALGVTEGGIALRFPEGWLEDHPLSRADLAQEADYLAQAGITLAFE